MVEFFNSERTLIYQNFTASKFCNGPTSFQLLINYQLILMGIKFFIFHPFVVNLFLFLRLKIVPLNAVQNTNIPVSEVG